MELKVSAEKPGFSSSDGTSDPEDQEISEGEDEDDDRNHKHRRREERSQSMEGSSFSQDFQRPFQKRNRAFQNDHSFRSSDAHSYFGSERAEKRRPSIGSFSARPPELGQRSRGNQPLHGKVFNERSRGMEPFSWGNQHNVSPAFFPGMSMANVNNSQGTSWPSYGLLPGVPGGGLDPLNPLGLQGALGPAFNTQMNTGIPRQRCRDFEERGFCLRGDMCPMEHGINRIVVDDFQSLSQFNLPVSAPGSQLVGTSPGHGARLGTSSGSSLNGKGFDAKLGKLSGSNGGVLGESSDVYDPDQPQLTNDKPVGGPGSFIDDVSGGQNNDPSYVGFTNELSVRNISGSPSYVKQDGIGAQAMITSYRDIAHQGLLTSIDGNGLDSSYKPRADSVGIQKPSQKALCTLFVNAIPIKDNKREALLSHFQKFGEVVDIYIPMNSERAFVQFSKREEAETALKAPDAVMGNRFIKLRWANRDNISNGKQGFLTNSYGMTPKLAAHPVGPDKAKENPNTTVGKDAHVLVTHSAVNVYKKPLISSAAQNPLLKKNMENLEILKEELRKKQQILDQKRNEFKLQLDRLEKKAAGSKNDAISDHSKNEFQSVVVDHPNAETLEPTVRENEVVDKAASPENSFSTASTSCVAAASQQPIVASTLQLVSQGTPIVKRFKLDNRPTAFRIVSPLPTGLAKIDALEKHFTSFGGLSSVELEGSELEDTNNDVQISSGLSACISFTKRHFAEKAFFHGKLWNGHKLNFIWVTSSQRPATDIGLRNLPSSSEPTSSSSIPKPEEGDTPIAQTLTANASEQLDEGDDAPTAQSITAHASEQLKAEGEEQETDSKSSPISSNEDLLQSGNSNAQS